MVLGKLTVPGRPAHLDNCRAMAFALAMGAGGCCLDIVLSVLLFLSFFWRRPYTD